MKQFYQKIDKRSRTAMTAFLKNHFRYHTMNSWNKSTSYANRVKIHSLGLPTDIRNKAWDILEQGDVYDEINLLLTDFAIEHDYRWQCGFNGRSSGYIVLYRSGKKLSGHKSYCISCAQRNYTSIAETGDKCGRCDKNTRIDYAEPAYETFSWPGRDIDQDEDFSEWNIDSLRERVELIEEFDQLCDSSVATFVDYCKNYSVVDEEIMVPKTIQTLKPVEELNVFTQN